MYGREMRKNNSRYFSMLRACIKKTIRQMSARLFCIIRLKRKLFSYINYSSAESLKKGDPAGKKDEKLNS
jgi:hypothetical protein